MNKLDEANLIEINQFFVKGSGCEKMRHSEHSYKDSQMGSRWTTDVQIRKDTYENHGQLTLNFT